jgi:Cys-tRNA(Pro) deacylase
MMVDTPPASTALAKSGIPHLVFQHSGEVTSLEQAARERGQRPGQVVRSIVFYLGERNFAVVLVAGQSQISWKRLRQHLSQSRVRMATPAEVLEVTGCRIGTVSPFGLRNPLRIIIDPALLRQDRVSVGCGIRNMAVVLRSADLRGALHRAELADLRENS